MVVGTRGHGRRLSALSGSDRRARTLAVARHGAESRAYRVAVRGGATVGAAESSVDSDHVPLLDFVSREPARTWLSPSLGDGRNRARVPCSTWTGRHSIRAADAARRLLDTFVPARNRDRARRTQR